MATPEEAREIAVGKLGPRPVAPDDPDLKAYADAVWAEFMVVTSQPSSRIMTGSEFQLVRKWKREGVPFRVIATALRETKGRGNAGRLAYFESPVLDEYRRVLQARGPYDANGLLPGEDGYQEPRLEP